ncbi:MULTISPECIES: TetR family transcriptional regulator [Streptomyces]|uniref:TetR family transcriptional regulator n=1 Tax=Streptomyces cacaoi TaxID=1898 RepID=A0A4Y3R765_STRCI|nr:MULTISPECIES: TetR family transcriptional regulator [Streptomyces]NNG85850.1 TetR family transcriptional regulator [Streptomyces cacaoi]QHF93513.1 TetR family transcriptional regulator [Streptomyces sp. NHF165]GEB53471.1 TetR family transcriptional regulator [Streptomyces cacaoi]
MPVTAAASSPASGAAPAAGHSPLTERRKAETRAEIARTAAVLFAESGVRDTRAEDIARAAGVAPRTFYRYFATKEEAVAPLFAAGAQQWAEATRQAPAGLPLPEALQHGARDALSPDDPANAESLEWVRSLLRLADGNPALRSVWNDAHHAAEKAVAAVLAERTGADPHALPLRLAAGAAAAAVRIAVETWAAGDEPADGPEGPAALAVRGIDTLRNSPWSSL